MSRRSTCPLICAAIGSRYGKRRTPSPSRGDSPQEATSVSGMWVRSQPEIPALYPAYRSPGLEGQPTFGFAPAEALNSLYKAELNRWPPLPRRAWPWEGIKDAHVRHRRVRGHGRRLADHHQPTPAGNRRNQIQQPLRNLGLDNLLSSVGHASQPPHQRALRPGSPENADHGQRLGDGLRGEHPVEGVAVRPVQLSTQTGVLPADRQYLRAKPHVCPSSALSQGPALGSLPMRCLVNSSQALAADTSRRPSRTLSTWATSGTRRTGSLIAHMRARV